MSSKSFVTVLFCCHLLFATAQDRLPWETIWYEWQTETDDDTIDESTFELLQQLAEHPIDINHASRELLQQLPFLSEQQIMDVQEYMDRYGPMRSLGELRMIKSMDYRQLQLLPFFIYVGEVQDTIRFPRLKTIARYGHNNLSLGARVPFYERRGDRNGYQGYPYRHWLRYEFSYADNVRAGLVAAQDAGEPFFAGCNQWGYDAYSYYVQLRGLGRMEQVVVGKYKLSTGMGLVLNNSFSLGKVAFLQSLGRQQRTIRPHASRSVADYFRGAAATLALSRPLKLTLFGSYRPIDATLNADGDIATIVDNGLHRTPTEAEKKHNAHQTDAGLSLSWRRGGLHAGLTAVYTHLDRRLSPNTKTLYRRHAASGTDFVNASLDYGYTHYRFSLNGETAINADGALATINALSYQPSRQLSLVALQRFYGYRYTTLHGHAFSEGGHVQNESGIYLGGTWQPLEEFSLSGYADVAYFPWARYRVSQSSWSKDGLLEARYQHSRWMLKARYRLHLREQDNEQKKALRPHNDHRLRLTVGFAPNAEWTSITRADGVLAENEETEKGWMMSEQLSWKHRWCMLNLTAAYFDTDSYESRIYGYERQPTYEYAFPSYYGRGLRLALLGSAEIGRHWVLQARLGHTRYFDRSQIGSGLQQVDASSMTDLDVLLRWRF